MNQIYSMFHALAVPFRSRGRLLLLLLGLLVQPALAQTIRYVTPVPRCIGTFCGDGSSWQWPTDDLQGAINASSPGDEVWVTAGTYKPGGNSNTDRSHSFTLKSGVKVYGSVPFGATSLSQRGTTLPGSTTLSGNIGTQSNFDNSYHVVRNTGSLNNGTLLDGVVIADGFADGGGENGYAGGLYNVVSAGLSATITLENCQFINNASQSTAGALLSYANNSGSATVNCKRCRFDNNTAQYGGGAVFIGKNLFDTGNQRYFGNTGSSQLNCEDCWFQNNQAYNDGTGGGVYVNSRADATASFFKRCRFLSNLASNQGGAVYNLDGSLNFQNCSFVDNAANQGGGVFTTNLNTSAFAQLSFINSTFTANRSTTTGNDNLGGLLYIASRCRLFLTNSIVFNNGGNRTIRIQDASSTLTAINSLFDNTVTGYASAGNFTTTTSPFSNTTTLAIRPCEPMLNGSPPSTTSALIGTIDLNGSPRFFGSPANADLGAVEYQSIPPSVSGGAIVTDAGQSGSFTICPGLPLPKLRVATEGFSLQTFGWETSLGTNNWTPIADPTSTTAPSITLVGGTTRHFRRVARDCFGTAVYSNTLVFSAPISTATGGTIGGPTLVPYPLDVPLALSSVTIATGTPGSVTIGWQYSLDNGQSWTTVANSNSQTIGLPDFYPGSDPKTFRYQRIVTNGCNLTAVSNQVSVRVILRNSFIDGTVKSLNNIGVGNILITVVRGTTGLAGSTGTMTYTAVTEAVNPLKLGTFKIPVYWGFGNEGPVSTSRFTITASSSGHRLTGPFSTTLGIVNTLLENSATINFTDSTAFPIKGQVVQTCPNCLTLGVEGLVGCPLDDVDMEIRGFGSISQTKSGYQDGQYGRYTLNADGPGSYSISAKYGNTTFEPSTRLISITTSVTGINFSSPTSRTITGKLTAGCNEAIAEEATLKFSDVLPKAADNTVRTSCFVKQVKTGPDGSFTVVLPARTYKVSIEGFTPKAGITDINLTTLQDFFAHSSLADSLVRDLSSTTAVTTLNLTYQRPPQIAIVGLPARPTCNTTLPPILEQTKPYALSVVVYQGSPAKGCLVPDRVVSTTATSSTAVSGSVNTPSSHTVLVTTDIRTGGVPEDRSLTVTKGIASWTLTPGTPNVAGDFTRTINVQYPDAYGRPPIASLLQSVIVTGYRSNSATFATVSPEVPLLVLHDPPGDKSFSFWETEQSQSSALRFYTGGGVGGKYWAQVKAGFDISTGIGVETENSAWLTVGGSLEVNGRQSSTTETIVTSTLKERIATSAAPDQIGSSADVFVGGAMNILYATADVISLSQTTGGSCRVVSKVELVVAPNGFKTQFHYTDREIRTIYIKRLQDIVAAYPPTSSSAIDARRQISVWEQVLQDNENRKKKAPFERNISFGAGVGEITQSRTKAQTESTSIDFQVEINAGVAFDAGFEVGGSGGSAGYELNVRMETGKSENITQLQAITTGYTLGDDDNGDNYTVDVKTDPVYSTPVFDVIAAETSCPREDGTIGRDAAGFTAPVTVLTNIAPYGTAEFALNISNISQVTTDDTRTFIVLFDASSNPGSADVKINGSSDPVNISVNRFGQAVVNVKVKQPDNSSIYNFEGLRFRLIDGCDSDLGADGRDLAPPILLSAFFRNSCSPASFITPEPGWVSAGADNDRIPIWIGGYTPESLSTITLQYRAIGASNWTDVFDIPASELTNSTKEALFNTSGLSQDGAYSIRLKTTCPTGNGGFATGYSPRSDGLIDRQPPEPFGNTLPANDVYLPGNTIGITYNEPIGCSRLTNASVTVKRLVNGQPIVQPILFSVGCSGNQVVLVPSGSLSPYLGEVLSVTLTNVADQYGNGRTTPDIWQFAVGSSTIVTGSRIVSVRSANSPLSESATSPIRVTFPLSGTIVQNVLVNFNLTGTASFGTDYSVASGSSRATVDGVIGSVTIPAGATGVTLLIYPINDGQNEPDETIIVSLLEGGDYTIGTPSSVTVEIRNDDPVPSPNVITSIRTGNWEDTDTWDLARLPLKTDQVILDQNHTVTILTTGIARKLTPRLNSRLRFLLPSSKLRLGF